MSNPQLASNASSALLATINESPGTANNSYVYSETDAITPQTSMQWDNLVKSSGSAASGQSLHWDINKNGYLTKIVLGLRFRFNQGTPAISNYMAPNWAVNAISEITISSGGRVIDRWTRESLFAHVSEQPDYVQKAYVAGLGMQALHKPLTVVDNVTQDVFLNLPGFWEQNKTALNTSFLQPLSVTVRFSNWANISSGDITLETDSDYTRLYCQYRNMQDPVDSATIQSNYGDGLLSQLITTHSQENGKTFTAEATDAVTEYTVDLKETSCVESMYVMMIMNPVAGDNVEAGIPQKINNIEFKSNGNSYVNLPAELLQLYGTQSVHGDKGFGACNYDTENSEANGNMKYVYKIDFGQGSTDRNELTNLLSFRELSNPQVTVKFQAATTQVQSSKIHLFVTYKRKELSNTVSSNGKFQIALSN